MSTGPALRVIAEDVSGQIKIAIESLSVPVAKAATLAIKDAALILKAEGRAMIRAAGFSQGWGHAYKVTVFPAKGYSVDAAAFGVMKGIDYSDIYATGGKISGSPLLWIPFSTTPKLDRRKTAADVRDYSRKGVKLFTLAGQTTRGGHPILGETIAMSRSQAGRKNLKITKTDVLTGSKRVKGKRGGSGLVRRTVPLFFGVSSITVRKRLDWQRVQATTQDQVAGLYDAAIKSLADKE